MNFTLEVHIVFCVEIFHNQNILINYELVNLLQKGVNILSDF